MRQSSLWSYGCTGAVGGLVVGLLATQNPTITGALAVAAIGSAGAVLRCWTWWSAVRPGQLCVRRQLRGECPECGYDLTGNMSGVCPECGQPT